MGIICCVDSSWQPNLELQALEGATEKFRQTLRACSGETKSTLMYVSLSDNAIVWQGELCWLRNVSNYVL